MPTEDLEIVIQAARRARKRRRPASRAEAAVADAGTLVVGSAPAVAGGSTYTAVSQALGGAAHDAALGQVQAYQILHTSTTLGVDMVLDQAEGCGRCGGSSGSSCNCHDPGPRRPVPVRPRRRARRK